MLICVLRSITMAESSSSPRNRDTCMIDAESSTVPQNRDSHIIESESFTLPKNLDSQVIEGILEYLLEVVDDERLGYMAKLASFAILNKLFKTDTDYGIRKRCLQENSMNALLLAFDCGLSGKCDPAETVYIGAAMETLWHLSQMPIGNIQLLLSEPLVRRLLMYMNVDGDFYRYSSHLTNQLRDLCQNKHLIGQVKVLPMETERLVYIHLHTKQQLRKLPKLMDTFNICALYDTSSEDDISVTQSLIDQGLVWSGTAASVTHGGDLSREPWQDIMITQVLDGGMFWAQLGDTCILEVARIQGALQEVTVKERKRLRPRKGECIMVPGILNGSSCLMRVQVLDVVMNMVDVFAVDYGFIFKVPDTQVFSIPASLRLSICRPQISLCSVANIQALPLDERLVAKSSAVLANICKQSVPAGEMLLKLGGIEQLIRLLGSCKTASSVITKQVLVVVNNLVCNPRLCQKLEEVAMVTTVLGVLECYIDLECDADLQVITVCISILTALLWKSRRNRQQFYENQGIDLVLRLVLKVGQTCGLYRRCVQLLKNFTGNSVSLLEFRNEVSRLSPPSQRLQIDIARRRSSGEPGDQSVRSSDIQRVNRNGRTRNTSEPVEGALHRSRLEQGDETSGSECSDNEADKCATFISPTGKQPQDLLHQNSSGQCPAIAGTYYCLGSRVRFEDDSVHELRPNSQISKVSATSIAEHVCGMLNTGQGGTVYFGIGKNRIVFGMEMNRDKKDQFRLGVDQLMHRKISPILLHFQFDFAAVPIVQLEPNGENGPRKTVIPDVYVIEITVRPSKGVIYTMLGTSLCYYRFGPETNPISRSELRQLIVLSEESSYEDEIRQLQQKRNQLFQHS